MTRIVVVGAGVAGLSVAAALKSRIGRDPVEVVVLEKGDRAGGNIRTEMIDGYLCESGPNGFLDSAPDTLALIRAIGLEPRIQASSDAARRRFVFRHGVLHQVPGSPAEFLRTRLLSWPGKLRVLLEPFARAQPEGDESIHGFATRRIGREAADALIDPMVSGVFGGDARELSLRACFPKMWQMEAEHGGLFRALLALRRERRRQRVSCPDESGAGQRPDSSSEATGQPGVRPERAAGDTLGAPAGRLTSFVGGMSDLVDGLGAHLGRAVQVKSRVVAIEAVPGTARGSEISAAVPDTPAPPRYLVDAAGSNRIEADAVVLTGPASESAAIVRSLDSDLARVLGQIATAGLVVICLGFDEGTVVAGRGPLDGFGFLVPRGEGPRILGALWESSIYAGRAPAGRVLLRVMLGGARDPAAVELPDADVLGLVRRDLAMTMGLGVEPAFARIFRHQLGIPQYTLRHLDRLALIEHYLERQPGLFLGGNSYRGVAINSCVADAGPLAERVLTFLGAARSPRPAITRSP